MKRFLIIAFLICAAVYTADAQLLEDSNRRLKTKKVERKGFLLFRNKKKINKSDGIPSSSKRTSPRYSSASSPFKLSRSSSPRFSSPRERQKRYSVRPRVSSGVANFKTRKSSPRYSEANPFRGSKFKSSPRYSGASPFKGQDYKVSPRYSSSRSYSRKNYKINIRYSSGSPFKGQSYKVSPRYSQGSPFRGGNYKVSPRFSSGSPFRGVDFKVRPRYTGTKIRLIGNAREWGDARHYQKSSLWQGDAKIKNRRIGDQHPSSKYRMAMKSSNPKVRKMLRKWNVFWIRINGNKQNPDGVNERVKEPKFDKKERVIWNN